MVREIGGSMAPLWASLVEPGKTQVCQCTYNIYVPLAYILHLLYQNHADFRNVAVCQAILNSAGQYVITSPSGLLTTYILYRSSLYSTVQFADFSLWPRRFRNKIASLLSSLSLSFPFLSPFPFPVPDRFCNAPGDVCYRLERPGEGGARHYPLDRAAQPSSAAGIFFYTTNLQI